MVWNCVGGDDSSSGPPLLMLRSIEIISMSHHLWSVVNAERNGGMARSRVQQSNRVQQHQFVDHFAAGQSAGQSSLQGKASSPTKNKIRIGGQFQTKFGKITFGVVVSFLFSPFSLIISSSLWASLFCSSLLLLALFFGEFFGVDLK